MSDAVRSFATQHRAATEALFAAAAERFRTANGAAEIVETTYLDTFDHRVGRKGETLAWVRGRGRLELRWLDSAGRVLRRLPMKNRPEFAASLPPVAGLDALARRIDVRRLLPGISLRSRRRILQVLDGREKTVARVVLDRSVVRPANGGRGRGAEPVVQVETIKGFEESAGEVADWLLAQEGVRELAGTELDRAQAAIEREQRSDRQPAAAPPPKKGDPAVQATRWILLRQLEVFTVNEHGVRHNLDTEFLHDFRVAIRRTRSALGQIRGVFPSAERSRFRKEFSWLGKVTGPLRDLDVYLLTLPEYRAWLPPQDQLLLDPLERLLRRRHVEAHQKVVRALDRRRYRRLVERWRSFLQQTDVPRSEEAPNAGRPVESLAAERIHAVWEKVLAAGEAIRDDTPEESVHRLRIDCKKLRYLLEFFGDLFPGSDVRRAVKSLKKLQDNLGEFNDLTVQQAQLRQIVTGGSEEEGLPQDTLVAIGRLLERLDLRQGEVRAAFHGRFERFKRSDARARLERWFGDAGVEAE